MPDPSSSRDVLERLLEGISNRQWHALADLYAEDAVVEHMFAAPARTRLEGRDAIREYFAAAARFPLELRARNIVVHDTSDPEVIVAEYDYDVIGTAANRSFRVANIVVWRVRDGQIVTSRDYHNHLVMAAAAGRLPQVVAALASDD